MSYTPGQAAKAVGMSKTSKHQGGQAPQREHVEPFGGFAGYSTFWEPPRVTVVKKDPNGCRRLEISAMHLDPRDHAPPHRDRQLGRPARSLRGSQKPDRVLVQLRNARAVQKPQQLGTQRPYRLRFWGTTIRARMAQQLEKVRHEGDYSLTGGLASCCATAIRASAASTCRTTCRHELRLQGLGRQRRLVPLRSPDPGRLRHLVLKPNYIQ
jgi:hypothetical protein